MMTIMKIIADIKDRMEGRGKIGGQKKKERKKERKKEKKSDKFRKQ